MIKERRVLDIFAIRISHPSGSLLVFFQLGHILPSGARGKRGRLYHFDLVI